MTNDPWIQGADFAPERRCPTCESLDHRECDDEVICDADPPDAPNSPGPDFTVSNEGTLFIFNPLTPAARDWINENVAEPNWWGNSLIVEHRYARPLGLGIVRDGLELDDA